MANNVFANMREVSCKAADGKAICAFPDVCMTPPENPTTPPGVPIPYPNTGMASDCTSGSRSVKISGKEVMLKNKSYFSKSTGDEAGCATKKGVITSVNRGKVYFNSWSMDVKVEGENVVRHLDLTTHNHGSVPGNTPTWPYVDSMAADGSYNPSELCKDDIEKEKKACEDFAPYKPGGLDACAAFPSKPGSATQAMTMANKAQADDCLKARVCQLVPYTPKGDQGGCCPGQTGHHLVEAAAFHRTGRGLTDKSRKEALDVAVDANGDYCYSTNQAPCVCAFGTNQYHGTHGLMHAHQGSTNRSMAVDKELEFLDQKATVKAIKYSQARESAKAAISEVFPTSGCDPKCIGAQLDAYHKGTMEMDDDDYVKAIDTGYTQPEDLADAGLIVNANYQKTSASAATNGRFSKAI